MGLATKTNAERLERIKDSLMNSASRLSVTDEIFLLYQAERAQQLEAEIRTHASHGRNFTNQHVVELRIENARLRKALEHIKENSDDEVAVFIARKTLEGEE